MTNAKPAPERRLRRPLKLDDLSDLDPESPFRQKVEALRIFIAEHSKPMEEWDATDHAEFLRLSNNDALAIGLAVAAPGGTTATSENPHRPYGDDEW